MPKSKPKQHLPSVIIVALCIAALVGAVSGALSATIVSGMLRSGEVLGTVWLSGAGPSRVVSAAGQMREEENATIDVVRDAIPAVVSVVIKKHAAVVGSGTANDLVEIGGGSGFFVGSRGEIVTNKHVVADADAVYFVVTNDGVELPATIVATDPLLDIAILSVAGGDYPTIVLGDSDTLHIGQTVIAVGNTLSEFRNTVTKGVVSGMNRRVTAGDEFGPSDVIERAIQTDAAINPGNSGGPLLNLSGEVVGVNTAVSVEGQAVGFAIPANEVKKAVTDVAQFGRIIRPWLGVRYVTLTPDVQKSEGLSVSSGALIAGGLLHDRPAVAEHSPAAKAGLVEGDIVLSVNGKTLVSTYTLGQAVGEHAPGDILTFKIVRGETVFETPVTLEEALAP